MIKVTFNDGTGDVLDDDEYRALVPHLPFHCAQYVHDPIECAAPAAPARPVVGAAQSIGGPQ